MSQQQPIASVAHIAKSPAQAKVYVAMLRAEGIPAFLDGDSLADEVAISRQVMNLNGTRVMVPTNSLEQARELLAHAAVDSDELERQAMAAEDPEPGPLPSMAGVRTNRLPMVMATSAAIMFGVLWLSEVSQRIFPGRAKQFEHRRQNTIVHWQDTNGDGLLDQCRVTDADGLLLQLLQWREGQGYVLEAR